MAFHGTKVYVTTGQVILVITRNSKRSQQSLVYLNIEIN